MGTGQFRVKLFLASRVSWQPGYLRPFSEQHPLIYRKGKKEPEEKEGLGPRRQSLDLVKVTGDPSMQEMKVKLDVENSSEEAFRSLAQV